jgi:hypothetical protein
LLVTSFGPRTIIKGTRDKKNYTINKIFNSNNKKYKFLLVKNTVLLRKRRSSTRNEHKPQTTKLQSANYFANTNRIFQHTLRDKTVKLRINLQTNHVRQKDFKIVVTFYLDG